MVETATVYQCGHCSATYTNLQEAEMCESKHPTEMFVSTIIWKEGQTLPPQIGVSYDRLGTKRYAVYKLMHECEDKVATYTSS